MNIYDLLPEDIWVKIILRLNCRTLSKLYDVSEQFYKLSKRKSLYEKCKSYGFPRIETKVHDVSKSSGKIYDYDNKLLYFGKFRELLINHCTPKMLSLIKSTILDLLCSKNIDLVRGDIVDFKSEQGLFMYSGDELFSLKDNRLYIT